MKDTHVQLLAQEFSLKAKQIENTLALLAQGATVPFISRYRKEMTGSLDEVQVAEIKARSEKLQEIDQRRQTILKTIEEQGKLTPELRQKLEETYDPVQLEDLYLPYKPKRKTRASVAREKGLEPLAEAILKQHEKDIFALAKQYLSDQVESPDEALQGARDIVAETANEDIRARNRIRHLFSEKAVIRSKVVKAKAQEGEKYKDYFDFEEQLAKCPSHRLLAMRRGEKEGILRISVFPPEEKALQALNRLLVKKNASKSTAEQIELALHDGYKRLMQPSIENEFAAASKQQADSVAIRVFAENLRQLLLAAPLGQKRILAIDPGYRTGCKVVCLDSEGNLLHNETIYPHNPQKQAKQAAKKIQALVSAYSIEAIAIGNGTASRETEDFIRNRVYFDREVQVFVVSENGASVYSASPIAREEFPQFDVTVRGAVSIGRRLSDPLAELVKIDPKSIGVGQYQHDVDQNRLQQELDRVVESCVNKVGVDLNTASKHLLTYVSGLGNSLAQNIVDYRRENGAFRSRKQLLKVPRLGKKAFEQCAGFLRIREAENPLDNSAVHPESYPVVERIAKKMECSLNELVANEKLINQIKLTDFTDQKTGLPTLKDIREELKKPGRDPRKAIQVFEFSKEIFSITDVKPGMQLPGIVTNITNFGAFVDIGIKENGLIHISNLKEGYVANPADVVSLHQHVVVKVLDVDTTRKRIQLSLKEVLD